MPDRGDDRVGLAREPSCRAVGLRTMDVTRTISRSRRDKVSLILGSYEPEKLGMVEGNCPRTDHYNFPASKRPPLVMLVDGSSRRGQIDLRSVR